MGEKKRLLIALLLLGSSNYNLLLSSVYALLFNYFCLTYLTFLFAFALAYVW